MNAAFVLAFCILSGDPSPIACRAHGEEGTVTAASCANAEAFVRAGLRPGQHLHVVSCEPAS
jgi:hypothetical protein